MDFLKKVTNQASGSHSNTNTQQPAGGAAPVDGQAAPAQQKDYGDKVADQLFNRSGYGNKVSESNREKITDFARGQYEKATGKKVDPKYSN
ncbi:hypothetical protein Micbo1qcDRAFT_164521 [Microdochium bolleyi]|uniref:Uncharacterized protein n=1 Tax=Microdochium bolleyi TaxID=196109 RepID=A0A136IYZ7_9PEZI|nr:hypothetical protein Micbo1qcDRAFT_164521 [Microdochium bolleyi]